MTLRILVRGGGDLASGVAARLHRAGWQVIVAELSRPMAVRRYVSFAQAVYDGEVQIEEITGRLVANFAEVKAVLNRGAVAVMVDPQAEVLRDFRPQVLVDGRMRKRPPEVGMEAAPLVIGLGPGFTAGIDCHAVIETNRGPFMGRVIREGPAQADTGVPEKVAGFQVERVLRAPAPGVLEPAVEIGAHLRSGDLVARVDGLPVTSPFEGVLRGLIYGGLVVHEGEKIGDIDPRGDARLCWMISDKSLAVGGGVLETILSFPSIRAELWNPKNEIQAD